jgi:hypothetical protein
MIFKISFIKKMPFISIKPALPQQFAFVHLISEELVSFSKTHS